VSSNTGTIASTSFSFLSAPDVGDGPFFAAAHVNATGIGGLESRWIAAVPEPSAALLALAGAGLAETARLSGKKRGRAVTTAARWTHG
jgi:hypothetical protein